MKNNKSIPPKSFLQRKAKLVKKQFSVKHTEALNIVSKELGFHNFKHYQHQLKNENKLVVDATRFSSSPEKQENLNSTIFNKYPLRFLLHHGISELIKRGKVNLEFDPKIKEEDGYIFLDLFGHPSVLIWRHIGFEEVEVTVWWKYDHQNHPQKDSKGNARESFNGGEPLAQKSKFKDFVGVVVLGWLERKTGKYLMGKGNKGICKHYARKGEVELLRQINFELSSDFDFEGKVFV